MSNKTNLRILVCIDSMMAIVPALSTLQSSREVSLAITKLNESKMWMENLYYHLDKSKYDTHLEEEDGNAAKASNALTIPADKTDEVDKIAFILNALAEIENEVLYLSKLDHNFLFAITGREHNIKLAVAAIQQRITECIGWLNDRSKALTFQKVKAAQDAEDAKKKEEGVTGMQTNADDLKPGMKNPEGEDTGKKAEEATQQTVGAGDIQEAGTTQEVAQSAQSPVTQGEGSEPKDGGTKPEEEVK